MGTNMNTNKSMETPSMPKTDKSSKGAAWSGNKSQAKQDVGEKKATSTGNLNEETPDLYKDQPSFNKKSDRDLSH